MKFTYEEFQAECNEYRLYGIVVSSIDLPTILMKDYCVLELRDLTPERLEYQNQKVLEASKTLPQFKTRLLDNFEEIEKSGLLK